MANALLTMLIALILAYIISEIFRRFGLPRVIGQILAGIVLGTPLVKGVLFTEEVSSIFQFITNIGIILLFFFIGLEISLVRFKKHFMETSLIAVFNTTIPLALGFLAGKYLFGFSNITSMILGISVSVSSAAISLDILEELRLLRSKIGGLIIGSGTVDDVFELLLISLLLVVFHSAAFAELSFNKLLLGIIVFVLVVILSRFLLIPMALKIFEKDQSKSTLFMGALIIVLLMSYLSEFFGIGSFLGALIAGVLLRQTLLTEDRKPWRKNEISHSIHMLSFGFLIPLFFVNVGLNTSLNSLNSNLLLILVFLIIDIVGTLLGTVIGVVLSKGSVSEGLIVGWGVVPKGDTEMVIATIALNKGLINVDLFTAIVAVALISTFIAPIMFKMLLKKHAVAPKPRKAR
ncbi:cation:proton antiporter [Candidatus Woesearchaeota archaeon]|nr:cation:proton antiporter [Candidatus Woesearchaeota archaeon]